MTVWILETESKIVQEAAVPQVHLYDTIVFKYETILLEC
jgi:hypothetical protein